MIHKFGEYAPIIHDSCLITDSAEVIGEVFIEEKVSVWFNAVIRADDNKIFIGKGSNIQDNCTLHTGVMDDIYIGENVTVGHGAIVHGCKINNNCIIGMGAIILDGAEIGENTIIGAGSVVTSNKVIPSGVLCIGSPAKVVRELTEDDLMMNEKSAEHYSNLIEAYNFCNLLKK